LTILCWNEPEKRDINLSALAEFLGLAARFLRLDSERATDRHMESVLPRRPVCLAASAATLTSLARHGKGARQFRSLLLSRAEHFLVYGVGQDPGCLVGLNYLTGGLLSSVVSVTNSLARYEISPRHKVISKQLTGLSVEPVNLETDVTFAPNGYSNNEQKLITIEERPFFIALKLEKCHIFLVGCKDVADVNAYVSPGTRIRPHFSQLIPAMMFLKAVFKDAAWHAPAPYANFTIDDPLIQKRYGFLRYDRLLKTMDSCGFATSIAFIPWNYQRTSPDTARLLRSRPDRFSLVIHGCDHTAGEFGVNDVSHLSNKINLAIERMERHALLTGLPYERVMVFPQGVFSTAAMRALASADCLAAVNSTALPVPEDGILVQLKDLLDVAILSYEGFPLFVRRYPGSISDCALDLFLERPLLLVEHHGYFRRGWDEITEFVSRVNALDERLSWRGLGDLVREAVLTRSGIGDEISVKRYVRGERAGTIRRERPEGAANGCQFRYGVGEHVRVFARRRLSEVRDNYLARNEAMLSLAHRLKGLVTSARGSR
jgi:hypothetical protein